MSDAKQHESALPDPDMRDPDKWVLMKNAPTLIGRDRATVYRWVKAGKIRVYRPRHELFLFIPDLRKQADERLRRVAID